MGMALALAASVCADTEKPHRSPVNAMPYYWFRTERGISGPMGPADPRLVEMAAALSAGELGRCREIAQGVLDSSDSPDQRSEARAYLVESYLAEGDFAGARAAAERLNDAESLLRANNLDAAYTAEVGRLQRIVATTQDTEMAAWAQLRTAQAHELVGKTDVAVESYRKVLARYPTGVHAATAVRRLASLLDPTGLEPGALLTLDAFGDTYPGSAAARALARVYRAAGYRCFRVDDRARAVLAWERSSRFESDLEQRAADLLSMGESLIVLQRYEEAHTCLQRVMSSASPALSDRRRQAAYLDAVAYHDAGNFAAAIEVLARLVAEGGGDRLQVDSQRYLDDLRRMQDE